MKDSSDLFSEYTLEDEDGGLDFDQQVKKTRSILRTRGFSRSFVSINLATFTLVSAGFSSLFVPTVSISSYKPPTIVASYSSSPSPSDPLSTLPYVQLPGFNSGLAFAFASTLVLIYVGAAYIYSDGNLFSNIRRRVISSRVGDRIEDRVDYVQSKLRTAGQRFVGLIQSSLRNLNPHRHIPDESAFFYDTVDKIDNYAYDYNNLYEYLKA